MIGGSVRHSNQGNSFYIIQMELGIKQTPNTSIKKQDSQNNGRTILSQIHHRKYIHDFIPRLHVIRTPL